MRLLDERNNNAGDKKTAKDAVVLIVEEKTK
jgi:hypothetical protein